MLLSTVPGTRTLSGCITAACAPAAKILAGLVTTDIGQCIEKDVYERCSSPLTQFLPNYKWLASQCLRNNKAFYDYARR